jgi:hypothetical protein
MKTCFAGLALALAVPAVADEHAVFIEQVEQAFSNLSHDYHAEWAFTESAMEDGVTLVGRYDPRLREDERWTLLSVDGREPTRDEIEDYRDDKEGEFRDHDDDDNEIDIVDLETLSLIEETEDYFLLRFVPLPDDDEDEEAREFMQHVDGTIKIVRDGLYPEYIDLRNDKPIRPAFSVKISRFLTHLTFGPAGGEGPIVPLTIEVEVNGRALLVVRIDESESVRYSDYENVGT